MSDVERSRAEKSGAGRDTVRSRATRMLCSNVS
jgi:hypothetical protein